MFPSSSLVFNPQSEQTLRDMEEARLQVSHTLQSCLQSNGNRRYATPPQQVAAFNRRVQPETLGPSTEVYVKPDKDCNTVFGNDVSFRISLLLYVIFIFYLKLFFCVAIN